MIGAEKLSDLTDWTDRSTAILFGDGAGAAVIQASERPGIEGTVLGADGSAAEILLMPGGGSREPASPETIAEDRHKIRMPNGRECSNARSRDNAACRQVWKNGHTAEDVDLIHRPMHHSRSPSASACRSKPWWTWRTSAPAPRRPVALDRAYRAGG